MIDWTAFLVVSAASLVAAALVVTLYSLGLRLLTTAGRILVVEPHEFTGAITVLSAKKAAKQLKRARKAAMASPLSDARKMVALCAGYACFTLCVAAVLYGVYLSVPALHA